MGSKQKGERKQGGFWGRLGGVGALILGGLKYLPGLLKLGKVGGTLWSMLLMVGTYALIFPWSFSIGLVIMIFIHEMGHVLAAKQKGLKVTAPVFIPFLGALILMKKQPQDARTEAYIALGGPLLGAVGAVLAFLLARWTGAEVLYAIALIGFMLNLFNLLPIHPLDGGRIVTAISRWFWVLGLIGGLVLIVYTMSWLLIFIWLLFAWQLWESFISRKRAGVRSMKFAVDVDAALFEQSGMWIPSEEHQRDLPFHQYCEVENQQHWCDVYYPGVGVIHRFSGFTGGFQRVRLLKTEQGTTPRGERKVRMHMTADYLPGERESVLRRDREYYRVPARVRFGYGAVYLGLAIFLVYMIAMLEQTVPRGPMLVS
jgi:Zn-dependent protease